MDSTLHKGKGDAYPPMDPSGTVDLSQIDYNLSLTPAQRMDQMEAFMELACAARRACIERYGFHNSIQEPAEAAR